MKDKIVGFVKQALSALLKPLLMALPWLLVLSFIAAIIGGGAVWFYLRPILVTLEPKNPERYVEMMKEAKALHLPTAKKIFMELDAMTENDVLWLKYRKLKAHWLEDQKFREENWVERFDAKKAVHETALKDYASKMQELAKPAADEKPVKWLPVSWKKMEPLRKSLVLREKCARYMEMEERENNSRRSSRDIPRNIAFVEKKETGNATPASICDQRVPSGNDDAAVEKSIQNLKEAMSYYYFVALLDDIGIPTSDVYAFPARFQRMIGDFSGD